MGLTLCIIADDNISSQKICGQYIIRYLQENLEPLCVERTLIINGPQELESLYINFPVSENAFFKEVKQFSESSTFLIVPANFLEVSINKIKKLLNLLKNSPIAILTFIRKENKFHEVKVTNEQAIIEAASIGVDLCLRYSGITAINVADLDFDKDDNIHSTPAAYLMMDDEDYCLLNDGNDLVEATLDKQKQLRSEHLERGVIFIDPTTVYLSFDTKIAPGVIIYPNVFIGPGVKVAAGVSIFSFSHIENAEIGDNVQIGPFARIRGNTTIQAESHIGNFVEIKNAMIGNAVKIKHLSYLGDATVGNNTNIGAGVITCNYDGKNKHRTEIDKNCFIGANSSLIAPIYIAEEVTIGAGSTITKDVEQNSLALSRTKQIVKRKS